MDKEIKVEISLSELDKCRETAAERDALRAEVAKLREQNAALLKACKFCEKFAQFSCSECQLMREELTVPCHADCEHRARISSAIYKAEGKSEATP